MKYLSIAVSLLLLSACSMPLRVLAGSSAYDDAKASALANTAAQAMAKISLQQARLEQQLLAVLTPEQRQQAQQWRGSRQGPHCTRRLP
ncbi:hypothetical protein [Janthinobacterium sp. LB3P112]|uniref:hypothetical protein n=1 Tax=Janthinobacterium sp. LB3P112 TaxID=3424196 RepID=UPI003F20B247